MSEQEIRAVAERLRRIHNGESVEDVYGQPYTTSHSLYQYEHPYHADLRAALGNWLAATPPDDSEPLDEAWLRSMGPPTDELLSMAEFRIPTVGMHTGILDFRKNGQVHICGVVLFHPPKTRGDLRLLCKALGITLKEPAL